MMMMMMPMFKNNAIPRLLFLFVFACNVFELINGFTSHSFVINNKPSSLLLPRLCPWKHPPSELYTSNKNSHFHDDDTTALYNFLLPILDTFGYSGRIQVISDLPMMAEFQIQGKSQLGSILEIIPSSSSSSSTASAIPRFRVEYFNDMDDTTAESVIDIGQLTTIWKHYPDHVHNDDENQNRQRHLLDITDNSIVDRELQYYPVGFIEKTLDDLYHDRIYPPPPQENHHRGRNHHSKPSPIKLTKKQIPKLLSQVPTHIVSTDIVEPILRHLVKVGQDRFLDSTVLQNILLLLSSSKQPRNQKQKQLNKDQQALKNRALASRILALDSEFGGRFKRVPCMFLETGNDNFDNNNSSPPLTCTVFNGGWLVVDPSVRAGTEGRKFALAAAATTTTTNAKCANAMEQQPKQSKQKTASPAITTTMAMVNERIIHRLECLAMGQSMATTMSNNLEVDVRQALESLHLPLTPQGAKDALLQIGRWSTSSSTSSTTSTINPWPKSTLEAAEWYQNMNEHRRTKLSMYINNDNKQKTSNNNNDLLENRVDWTKYPSICIDAKKASFRDDAVSVRPRASTGRTVNKEASQWEIGIHIADVSDIYSLDPTILNDQQYHDDDNNDNNNDIVFIDLNLQMDYLASLQEASASRGTSRYDLPLGPLHLMPPVALQALSLDVIRPDFTNKDEPIPLALKNTKLKSSINRCVTLWVYIDERNGKVIDAGLERSIISCPLGLTFASATALLDGSIEINKQNPKHLELSKAKAALSVVERNLLAWTNHQQQHNEAARAREHRFAVKEFVAKQQQYQSKNNNNNNRGNDTINNAFSRSRGNRVVDAALDLYGYAIDKLLQAKRAPIPRVAGAGVDRRGRIATAPLRRYVDGISQRQALSVLCDYGGPPMSTEQCIKIAKEATDAINTISNLHAEKHHNVNKQTKRTSKQQKDAIKMLQAHVGKGRNAGNRVVPAVATGRPGEVVIIGIGALATCRGIQGTLKPGEEVMVQITKIDVVTGTVQVTLAEKRKRGSNVMKEEEMY